MTHKVISWRFTAWCREGRASDVAALLRHLKVEQADLCGKDAARMRGFRDVPEEAMRSVRARTLVVLGDRDIVKLEHAVELARLVPGTRLLLLPAGHGDCLGEAVVTQGTRGSPSWRRG